MWYPEEPVTYCSHCDLEIPSNCCWRSRGVIISATGRRERTPVLNSLCPECATHRNVGLDGSWLYRRLYGYLWELRYPRTKPPRLRPSAIQRETVADWREERRPRRRAG